MGWRDVNRNAITSPSENITKMVFRLARVSRTKSRTVTVLLTACLRRHATLQVNQPEDVVFGIRTGPHFYPRVHDRRADRPAGAGPAGARGGPGAGRAARHRPAARQGSGARRVAESPGPAELRRRRARPPGPGRGVHGTPS